MEEKDLVSKVMGSIPIPSLPDDEEIAQLLEDEVLKYFFDKK